MCRLMRPIDECVTAASHWQGKALRGCGGREIMEQHLRSLFLHWLVTFAGEAEYLDLHCRFGTEVEGLLAQ